MGSLSDALSDDSEIEMSQLPTQEAESLGQPRARSAPSPFVTMDPWQRTLVLAGLGAYLVLVGLLAYFQGETTTLGIYLALTLNIVLLALPFALGRSQLGWTHPVVLHVFLTFLTVHLVRTPLYVHGLDYHLALPDWTREQLASLVGYHLLLGALALVSYYMGFFSGLGPSVPAWRFRQPRSVAPKALLVSVLALLVFALYVRGQGGVSDHLLSWAEEGRVNAIRGEGHWLRISRLGALATLLWFAFDRRALSRPLFLAAAGGGLAINFLGSGSRSSVVSLLVIATLIWMIQRRRISPVRTLVVVLICLVVIASLGRLRRGLSHGSVDWGVLVATGVGDSAAAAVDELLFRYGALDSAYAVLARVPDEHELLYGRSYLTLLALPIPRAVWPEKPGTPGKLAGNLFYGVRAGIPPGAVGEGYWNLHVPGVILLFLLFGIFHRFAARFLERFRDQPGAVALYALTMFWSQPSITAIAEWFFSTLSVLTLLWLGGAFDWRLRRHPRRRHRVLAEFTDPRTP